MRERLETQEDDMSSKVIRQTMVGSLFVAILWIALLVGVLLILSSIAGNHTGTMLIAPPYQHLHGG